MKEIEAAIEALEMLEPYVDGLVDYSATAAEWPMNNAPLKVQAAIAGLRSLKEQEPVAWAESDGEGGIVWSAENCFSDDPTWHENPVGLVPASALAAAQQEIENLKAYAKHERSLGAEPFAIELQSKEQELEAAQETIARQQSDAQEWARVNSMLQQEVERLNSEHLAQLLHIEARLDVLIAYYKAEQAKALELVEDMRRIATCIPASGDLAHCKDIARAAIAKHGGQT